jgi:hypothetical protein
VLRDFGGFLDCVSDFFLRVTDHFLDLSDGHVNFPLGLQLIVSGQRTDGLLDLALDLIDCAFGFVLVQHVSPSSLRFHAWSGRARSGRDLEPACQQQDNKDEKDHSSESPTEHGPADVKTASAEQQQENDEHDNQIHVNSSRTSTCG